MIGEIQQFNQLIQASKESFDKRFSAKQEISGHLGRGIGMHQR